jgi:hypothetical protein
MLTSPLVGAALLWGDVMHTANQPYNVLDGADKQANPRSADVLARLNRYAPVLRAYCAAGDPVCAGGDIVADHLNYFELYTDDASSWVVSKINGTPSLCPATSSTAAPSSATSPAASSVAPPTSSAAPPASSAAPPASSAAPPASSTAAPSSAVPEVPAVPMPYPTSIATPAPFPSPVPYPEDSCVVVYEVEYEYV